MANGHNAKILECPNLNAFVSVSPGAIICWLSKLPVLVFSKGSQLLIAQAIAGLTSIVGGFALGGGTPTVIPWSFLDQYSEVPPPSWSDSLFAAVLPSHVTLVLPAQRGGTPAPAPVRHGGPPSCPDPVSIDVASSAHPAASLHFGGHGLHYGQCLQHVHSSLASCRGSIPFDYGGLFRTAPPTTSATTIMATAALLRIMGGIRLSNFLHRCMGGIKLLLGMFPCLCTAVHPFPRAMGGISVRLHWLPQA
jgi:hypothetical protein